MSGITLRHAVEIALEGMPDAAWEVLTRKEVRRLICLFVMEYARNRGVIIEEHDFEEHLDAVMRERFIADEPTPVETPAKARTTTRPYGDKK